ncbi:MAG: SIR2 family protein [Gemmatimonadetes bacterium]|nr:SIR2 family protein [Gemmatimonadota bacterium]
MSKTTPSFVPDNLRPYLNEIAERLFSGHAAVMVGAGFSKNATPNSASGSGFPDWSQLGDIFYEKIHGKKPDNQSKYLNVLKLADEVQAAFGRPALDQILRNAIPDDDYEPSSLHKKLLTLPWSDIFTTNYDTLLERARNAVTSKRYEVVVNKEDLINSEKPRIVKLHGSFPSDPPFIITEEDYRCYPENFAPFVNTVRQALLENTLCLIGFSGDDPNFLQWIGWIRDNLGQQNSPKMYLIGPFSLSEAQKKLLERRNIVLVDLSEYPNVSRNHYKALEQFLDYLLSRKAEDNRLARRARR